MRHYRLTNDLLKGLNEFVGRPVFKRSDLGRELYRLENYDKIAKISPKKAKLLMATLFPEELRDALYLRRHKGEILKLAKRLHSKESELPRFSWTEFMVRRETLPSRFLEEEDLFRGNIIRFR